MATLEEITTQVTAEVEAEKPLTKQVNNDVMELTDDDYAQLITDRAADRFDQQENGYKDARQSAYGSIANQLDMMYWDGVNGTTVWADHIAQVKSDNPKPS